MKITVLQDQNIFDVALQTLGDVAGVFTIAELNGLEITERLQPGQTLFIPDKAVNPRIVQKYAADGVIPATEIDRRFIIEGVEIWGIEIDFIVS